MRGADASWIPASEPEDPARGVHDNLRNLGLDVLDCLPPVMGDIHSPTEGLIEKPFTAMAELQRKRPICYLGFSTLLLRCRGGKIANVVCVQNHYNLVHRADDRLVDESAGKRTAYVPFFPLGFLIYPVGAPRKSPRAWARHPCRSLRWLKHRSRYIS